MSAASAFSDGEYFTEATVEGIVLRVTAHADMSALETCWRRLQSPDRNYIYQNYDWVRLAYETLETENEPLIIAGEIDGGVHLILPLVVEKGLINTVRWAGKNHANLCCGLYSETFLKVATPEMMNAIVQAIRKSVGAGTILRLINQPYQLGTYKNPMVMFPGNTSSNVMFDLDLTQGMDAILDMGNGKRKRKLYRRQVRKAEEMGGLELKSDHSATEKASALEDFFVQKSLRFRELGVSDVFEPTTVRSFMDRLASGPAGSDLELLRLFELKVGGKTRAMYGCAIFEDYCQAWINSVTYDDFSDYSPGEMVLYMMIEQLISEGRTRMDLGIGAERYKYSWCRTDKPLYDVVMPLSVAATPLVWSLAFKTQLKSRLRNDERIWKHVRRLRKLLGRIS